MTGILGKKIGMTQVFGDKGEKFSVTVIQAGPCHVLRIIGSKESPASYFAVQMGFDEKKSKKICKAELKSFEKIGVKPQKFVRELRLNKDEIADFSPGKVLDIAVFNAGDFVDVTGISIGKGFQGGMKRWGWKGGPQTHGSTTHRRPGSIGSSTSPSRVFRGHHLPGRMGNARVTVKHLKVVSVEKDKNLIIVKGGVPGHKNSYLIVKKSRKQPKVVKK
ncbi:MAG: 50S ribosomal protein L3 [Candidatus Omnitrophica bacterium]|nr:50S ribosomal protein L3 [Candidatus Omnitrophota bacterium]